MKSENKVDFRVMLVICFIGLLLICTVYDLPIAKAVYNPDSFFGKFFEVIGTLPMPVVGIFSCIALMGTAEKKLCVETVLSYVFGVVLMVYFAVYSVICIVYALKLTLIPMLIGIFIWTVLSVIFTKKIIDSGNRKSLRTAAIIGVVTCTVAVIGVSIIKSIMGRARFNTLSDPDTQFTYWFLKQPFIMNASFPSGHAAESALTFCSLLVPAFVKIKDKESYKNKAFIASAVFTICVMFSRMVLGMHYATDVLAGAILTVGTLLILEACMKLPELK